MKNFDLDTKEGRFMFAVLAAAAEYEVELRAERQSEEIAATKRREATGVMLPGKKKTGRPIASPRAYGAAVAPSPSTPTTTAPVMPWNAASTGGWI